jgi:hypothetical protein
MRERWLPVGVLAGTLLGVNVIARLVVRLAVGKDDGQDVWIGAFALAAVGLVMLVAAIRWMRRYLTPRVCGELSVALAIGGVFSSVVGPFISSGKAFGNGFGGVLSELLTYLAVGVLGAFLGGLGIVIAGLDYKSQSWKRYADRIHARPRRVVRG